MHLSKCTMLCADFRLVLAKIAFRREEERSLAFIYADPPYLSTKNNYSQGFTEQDTQDLFKILVESNIRFALSEFDNPIILDLASDYGLNVIEIGERNNMKNRRTEILVTNYKKQQLGLFDIGAWIVCLEQERNKTPINSLYLNCARLLRGLLFT